VVEKKTKICESTTPKPSTVKNETTTTKSEKEITSTTTEIPKSEEDKSGNGIMTFFIMLMFVIVLGACWVYYAFTNPYSMSGQLLIKYRPSKWRSPASQVRYSASVHM
jgi:hypothetical protein